MRHNAHGFIYVLEGSIVMLGVSAAVILTHCAGVKVTHLGEYGGFLAADDVDPGGSSGDQGIDAARGWNSGDGA